MFVCSILTAILTDPVMISGKTDPYVTLTLGDQKIRSKKNSQTTVIGPPGEPIWNQVRLFSVSSIFVFHYVTAQSGLWSLCQLDWFCLEKLLVIVFLLLVAGFSYACCKS